MEHFLKLFRIIHGGFVPSLSFFKMYSIIYFNQYEHMDTHFVLCVTIPIVFYFVIQIVSTFFTQLFNCFLSFWYTPISCVCVVEHFSNFFTTKCSWSILCIFCYSPRISYFSNNPSYVRFILETKTSALCVLIGTGCHCF